MKVRELMSTDLITLERDETLDLAHEIMHLARIRHLPVVDGGRLVGLVTHRDLLGAQVSALAGLSREEQHEIESAITVASIMNENVRTISPEESALQAAIMMREHRFGCLPVVEDQMLVGIVTEADFLDLVIRALQQDGAQ